MTKIDAERLEDLKIYNEKAAHFRGQVLNEMATLELYINLYIASHFCGNDYNKIHEMQLLILGDNRSTLGGKIEILHNIAKIYDKKWMDKYKGDRTFIKDLNYTMEQRNVFAHRVIDLNSFYNNIPNGTVRFLKFKNNLDFEDYDEDRFNKLMALIYNLCTYFHCKYKPISTTPPQTKSVCTQLNRRRGMKHF
jgi:hypothetical protein